MSAEDQHVIALIAARQGSKGMPDKNLMPFCGKPLVAWSVEQASAASGVSAVWVTSDSELIRGVCAERGAGVIERPEALAKDTASSESAWLHALDEIRGLDRDPDVVIALQATSPLREPADLDRGLQNFQQANCDSLFSGSRLHDFFIWERQLDGELRSLNYDYRSRRRRQEVSDQYVENGSFYIFAPQRLRQSGNRLSGRIGVSPMDVWKSFEIDSDEDLELCEALMRHYLLPEERP